MIVNIIFPEDGWILNKMGNELVENLDYVKKYTIKSGKSTEQNVWNIIDDENNINYFICYWMAYKQKTKGFDIALFTHEQNDIFKERCLWCNHAISMSHKYEKQIKLYNPNIPVDVIFPGVDECFKPILNVGYVGSYRANRKGPELGKKISEIPWINFKVSNGKYTKEELINFYNELDYVLITSNIEGGPMALIEGLKCGKKCICPLDIGFVESFSEYVVPYENSNFESLYSVLEKLYNDKLKISETVKNATWKNWTEKHDIIFRKYLGDMNG